MTLTSPSPARLDHLPTELVTLISRYLLPSSLLSLRYTCHRFILHFSISVKTLFSRSYTPQSDQWLLFLCMLERDHRIRQLVCCKCYKPHHVSQFSDEERLQCPNVRKCLGFEGKLWVCPHKRWTFAEVQELRKGDQLKVFHPSLWPVEPCQCLKDGMFLHFMFMHVEASKAGVVEKRVKKALGLPRSRKCEHMRLREPARKCFQHDDCANLGCGNTEFRCRLCVEPGAFIDERVVGSIDYWDM